MTRISISDEKQDVLASVLDQLDEAPVTLQKAGKDVAIVLSPEQFEAFQQIKQAQLDAFFAARAKAAETAKGKGLTEEILNEILSE